MRPGAIVFAILATCSVLAYASIGQAIEPRVEAGPMPQATLDDVLVMTPSADTWYEVDVGTGAPVNATPQGANERLEAGWSDVGIDQFALMRFAIPSPMPDFRLEKAELELDIVGAGIYTFAPPLVVSGTMLVLLRPVESAWDEASLSSLAPPTTGMIAQRAEVAWGPCTAEGCGKAHLDITTLVEGWYGRPDTENRGLALNATGVIDRPTYGTYFAVGSRESERPPRLRLELVNVLSDETPTATATLTPVPTRTPTPSTTPGPTPTWEIRDFDGVYGASFEVSSFVEGTAYCPGYGDFWWLVPDRAFAERYAELTAHRSPLGPPIETTPYIVHARFRGRLSPPGQYGHLGFYTRQVEVLELGEMADTELCGMALPDLALATYSHSWANALPGGCTQNGPGSATLEVCIVNQGRRPATDAWVELRHEPDLVARRRICGLAPGETRCLAPAPMPISSVRIDVNNEVWERFEGNNWVGLAVPTFTPPPTCTPLPPGRPSPAPHPTATLQDCITPTAGPTPMDTATPEASTIHLPLCSQSTPPG